MSTPQQRRIVEIEISGYRAIDHIKLPMNCMALIEGANGGGKSSIAEAVTKIFDGGHDPHVIRGYSGPDGETGKIGMGGVPEVKKASAILRISDGSSVERFTTRKGSDWNIKTADGGVVKDAKREWIDQLTASFGFDPIGFMEAESEERVEWFLKIAGVEFSPGEVQAITGKPVANGKIDLARLKEIQDGVYERRREVNGQAVEAEKSRDSLFQAMPPEEAGDADTQIAELEQIISAARTRIATARSQAETNASETKRAWEQEANDKLRELEAEFRKLEQKFQADCAKVKDVLHEACTEVDAGVAAAAELAQRAEETTLSDANQKLALAKVRKTNAIQHETLSKQHLHFKTAAVKLRNESDALTQMLQKLDRLRETKLKDSSITGLELGDLLDSKNKPKGRDLVVNGVPWKSVNTSEKMLVAMTLGLHGSGSLKFMVCDRGSELDDDRVRQLAEHLKEMGVQMLVTRPEPIRDGQGNPQVKVRSLPEEKPKA